MVSTNARARRGFRLLLEEWGEPDAPEKSEILRTLLDYLFLQISRLRSNQISGQEQTGYQQLFARYFALMRAHHRETRNAKDYAGMLGVSYKHLNTVCRQVCTRTAKRALDEFNVLEMKRALATGDDSVEDLSVSFGFDETTNFIKYFKRHALVTPAGFRRGLRKGPVRD